MSLSPPTLGVDIGGTKVAAGLVDAGGRVRHRRQVGMPARGSAGEALGAVLGVIEAIRASAAEEGQPVREIGVCAPGPLDPRRGVILNPPNVPCWRDFPLVAELGQATQLPVRLGNDATAAALAEARWGAGQGHPNLLYVTFGTGIGTGILLDGRLLSGRTGLTPEGGHLTIDHQGPQCRCGKRGCIEVLASGTALARRAREDSVASATGPAAPILELAEGNPQLITAECVVAVAEAGDPYARGLIAEAVAAIGIWLGGLYDLLQPEVIVFGGGLGAVYLRSSRELRAQLKNWSIQSGAGEVPLLPAALGEDAGIAGAAALWAADDRAA